MKISISKLLLFIGAVFERYSLFNMASKTYLLGIKYNKKEPMLYYRIGVAYEKMNNLERAIDSYKSAVSLNTGEAHWYYRLGLAYEKRGKWKDSSSAYQSALNLNADEAPWYYRLGVVNEKAGKWEKAASAYRSAVDLNDENAIWNFKLGIMLSRIPGNLPDAVKFLIRAIEINPNDSSWLAELKYLKKMYENGENFISDRRRPNQWYDIVYETSNEYKKNYNSTNYWPIWEKIIQIISEIKPYNILDIGCGSGQLALAIKNQLNHEEYTGIDFSEQAIKLASKNVPNYTFIVADALSNSIVTSHFDLIICTEVLEHIEEDLFLLSRIKKNTIIIATVPNFDSLSHVRYFNSTNEVIDRYKNVLSKIDVEPVTFNNGIIYLITGKTI